MRYIVVAAGNNDFPEVYTRCKGDVIIACDGGLNNVLECGLLPNIYIGDTDSVNYNDLSKVSEKYIYNAVKDQSDLELAIGLCMQKMDIYKGYDEIVVYNATGLRIDHFLANIRLLVRLRNEMVKIVDINSTLYIRNKSFEVVKNNYKYISFFNIETDTIVSLKGFKYELNDYAMKAIDNICLSNEIIGIGEVTTNKSLIVIESID